MFFTVTITNHLRFYFIYQIQYWVSMVVKFNVYLSLSFNTIKKQLILLNKLEYVGKFDTFDYDYASGETDRTK